MILGVIADDFTGATDVASMLVRAGMRTVQLIGVPKGSAHFADTEADAIVVALKSRTAPVAEAVRDSLAAWKWLHAAGARNCYFKYCSTFDSTSSGNIGPVADALMEALGTDFTIACPALPVNGRTVYYGNLYVGSQLLSESSMRHHPLTPMTDSNLVRVLQAQVSGDVGLVHFADVSAGAEVVRQRFDELRCEGIRYAVVDAISDDHLFTIADACAELSLVTAGSGLALALPAAYAARGWVTLNARASDLPAIGGRAAVLSGSCSSATQAQVQHWIDAGLPAFAVDPYRLAEGGLVAEQALRWTADQPSDQPVLIYATAAPERLQATQKALGAEHAGQLVEQCLAQVASGLVAADVRRLVVAGGETSGAVVNALGITRLVIGATIEPGVPWTQAEGRSLQMALKSGNFGGVDFFSKALTTSAS